MSNSFVKVDKKKSFGLKKLWKYFVSTFSLNHRKHKIALSKQNSAPGKLLTAPISSNSPRLQIHHHHHFRTVSHHYYPKPNNHDQKLVEAPQPRKSLSQNVIAYDETSSNHQDQKLIEASPIPQEESNSLGAEITQVVPQKIVDKGKHIRNVTPEFEFFDDYDDEDEGGPGNRISRSDSKYITLSRFQLLDIDARAEEFIKGFKETMKLEAGLEEIVKSEQKLEQGGDFGS